MNRSETTRVVPGASPPPMNAIWRTIRGYILWTYERGNIHYDVMVTLILIFVFLTPYWINYKDKPIEPNPHPTGVAVLPDTSGGFLYEIEGQAITAKDDIAVQEQLLAIIEPIAGGAIRITRYETVRDRSGRILTYKVWIHRSM